MKLKKKIQPEAPVAVEKKPPYVEQAHDNCGGAIRIAARSKSDWVMFCSSCLALWEYSSNAFGLEINIPSEFTAASNLVMSTAQLPQQEATQ